MTFANPVLLVVGVLLTLVVGMLLLWSRKRRQADLARLGDSGLIDRLSASVNRRGRRWQTALGLAALALLVVAAARPQWGSVVREVEQEGLQLMVALDVSQSMLAQDIRPTRLDRAKLEIADLMARLNGDEIGVVLFSGATFVQVPLTSDYATARSFLDGADPTAISRPGTAIGDAIRTAANGFDSRLNSQKVLVIMTDGEDRETDPLAAAQEAADEGVLIYTIGFGTPEGDPVPETDAQGQVVGYKRDGKGKAVLSRLDEATLQEIARIGKGRYYRASADGRELDSLLGEIGDMQKAQLQSRFERRYIERFQVFLWPALIALVVSELIPDRVLGRRLPSPRSLAASRGLRTTSK